MRPVGSNPRGAALILVLMVVGILGLLALQMGLNAKANVSRAERLQQRTEAMLRLQSNEAALVFTLLTEPWVTGRERDTDNPYAKAWNFRGQPFEVAGIFYEIQDLNGLLSVPQRKESKESLELLLNELRAGTRTRGAPTSDRRSDSPLRIEPAGSPDDSVPVQSLDEIAEDYNLSRQELEVVRQFVSTYPNAYFNPSTAPRPILATRYTGVVLDTMISLQREDKLSQSAFAELTDSEVGDFVVFYPGPGLRVSTRIVEDGFRLGREYIVILKPYDFEPVRLWGSRRLFDSTASFQ